eukprot:CAMPEP_0113891294 /NCGR_PEP_ID=MMETSP0780_2-20120614/14673_1 /TAXON_ID=652834 /ORGANISM="Palpitomonas bilix" /LENGTH=153 /DNA_ID=CAMNT_0000880889 /DNA_START=62 /DNA_END=519 /DNA_ORIENTATION=- /assembly_acc=CAM_ASM_000599
MAGAISKKFRESLGDDVLNSEDPLDFYELLQKLGKGSFGVVYKARRLSNSDVVAIKLIHLDGVDDSLEEIRQEIAILRECNNSYVVSYYESFFKDDTLWIVMEYCGGGSISDIMERLHSPLTEPQIALVMHESLKGLKYLHEKRKIHRDIKGG